jgi:hypothetical protein
VNTKIYVVSHKNVQLPKIDGYQPIQVGKSLENFPGYIRDNNGDNIADKNANYCELTVQYWAWKNDDSDVKGMVHYRRFFENNSFNVSKESKMKHIISEEQIREQLNQYDMILPKKRNYYIETSYSHYIHAHNQEGLDITRQVISERFPSYLDSYDQVLNRKKAHMFNMLIAKKQVFDSYSEWLFDVLGEVEKRLDISDWTPSEARVYGYISELLMDVWLNEHKGITYKELNVGFMGNQHWIKKGFNFIARKVKG